MLIGLLGIASGLTAGVTGALLLPIRPEPWIERAGLALTVEVLFTFALFSGLAVVWAIFMPQWLDRALAIAATRLYWPSVPWPWLRLESSASFSQHPVEPAGIRL